LIPVRTISDLDNIRNNPSGNYWLMNDLDLVNINWNPIGATETTRFTGRFYGKGFTISNLTINRNTSHNGLFGINAGLIENVTLRNVDITSDSGQNGGLAGTNRGSIVNCRAVHVNIGGRQDTGGLVGLNAGTGTITRSSTENVNISGNDFTGGLAGQNGGVIEDCGVKGGLVTGKIPMSGGLARGAAGGLVGLASGTVIRSYSTADVSGEAICGGFAGYASGLNVDQCYATGNVDSTAGPCGGFVGYVSSSTISPVRISNSHASGIIGSTANGFLGVVVSSQLHTTSITNSYSSSNRAGFTLNGISVSSVYYDSDLVGIPTTNPHARTTAQMKTQSTYVGWDFDKIWIMESNRYPRLRALN